MGYLPVVLSHEVVGKVGEYERSMTAILDANLQRSIKLEMEATWDQLRDRGYTGSFLLTHNTGGSAEMFKTTASRTYNGGPISGLMGSYRIGKSLGYKNVIASDVDGTSFDVGIVVDAGARSYEFRPIIDRWMVGITMLQTTTMGAGGGSIARVNTLLNRLEVGLLRPRRYRTYGDRCGCRAQLHSSGKLFRRTHAVESQQGARRDREPCRQAARTVSRRSSRDDPKHRRRKHGLRD